VHFINRGCRWRYSMCKRSLFWDAIDEGSSKLQGGPPLSLFDMLLTTSEGLRTYVPFVVLLSSWMRVLPFCSLYSPLLGVLWFTYHWQGFIILVHSLEVKLDNFPTRESSKSCWGHVPWSSFRECWLGDEDFIYVILPELEHGKG